MAMFIKQAQHLTDIYTQIEQRVATAQATHPVWPCQMGCDACCQKLAHPPEITAVEWNQLYEGIKTLPNPIQAEIGHKIKQLATRDATKQPHVTCPLLNQKIGACHVYNYRPAACRMYGFYVSRHNNQWCQQIEDLYQEGKLEGAMLGNHSAMNRQIQAKLGGRRSIVTWWQELHD